MAEISEVTARLLDYVSYDTQSEDDRESIPSTKKQFELAHKLAGELKELGASQVRISEQGYVYACIPSNLEAVSYTHLDVYKRQHAGFLVHYLEEIQKDLDRRS